MKTKIYKNPTREELEILAEIIKEDELVAIPTETVYGLGANGLSEKAVKKVYVAKGRPSDNPLILHVADQEEINPLVASISPTAKKLMDRFWPGSLTLLFPKSELISKTVTGGLDTVAIRCPDQPLTRELIRLAGVPLAAPSANRSGRPSPTTAEDVFQDMDGRILAILDGGACQVGLESTVVEVGDDEVTILRPGCVTEEMLLSVVSKVQMDAALQGEKVAPKAPGMKYKHYAPKGSLEVLVGEPSKVVEAVIERIAKKSFVGLLVSERVASELKTMEGQNLHIITYADIEDLSHKLYESLLLFDREEIPNLLVEGVLSEGLGVAVMNRLEKASSHHITVL